MPRIVITHAVVDIERWLAGKAERAATISAYATDVTDYVAMDGSNTSPSRPTSTTSRGTGHDGLAVTRGCGSHGTARRPASHHRVHRA